MRKSISKLTVMLLLAFFGAVSESSAQSQVGNPTNAFWDGFNLPMQQVEPGVWAIYSGDINQDGTIDVLDMSIEEVDVNNFEFGYNVTDLNGDGASDVLDMTIIENNANLFLFVAKPQ